MDLRVHLTESQYEALKVVAEASGDSRDEWVHTTVIQDIELYFGHSKAIKEKAIQKSWWQLRLKN